MINKQNKGIPQVIKKQQSTYKILPQYVCSWLKDEKIRSDLIARIKYKKQKNIYGQDKIISDDSLAEEYYKVWMEQPSNKPISKLAMHPLLTIEDQQFIDQTSSIERNGQIKFSGMLTAGTVAFYWIFLSRMARFQRFFNDRNKNRFVNGFKKVFAIYSVLIIWQASLSSHYQKKLPQVLNQKGIFKKYGIQFQQKNV